MTQTGDAHTLSTTAWRRIAGDIEADIAAGDYVPGQGLPTVMALAARYGVHRHTVRQAFRHLQALGLVSVEQGRGTFVSRPRIPYRIGQQVSFRANLGAAGLTTTGRMLGAQIVAGSKEQCAALRLAPSAPLWRIETLNTANGTPISAGVHHLCTKRFPDFASVLEAQGASITAALRACGIPAYQRLETRLGAAIATPDQCALLALAEGAPVLLSKAIDGLADGQPIHLVDAVFAGERVEMLIDPPRA